jgi:hypothetical protein
MSSRPIASLRRARYGEANAPYLRSQEGQGPEPPNPNSLAAVSILNHANLALFVNRSPGGTDARLMTLKQCR